MNIIENTLNQLLHNASEMQLEDDPTVISQLSDEQSKLLDLLLAEWDKMDESPSNLIKIENKICQFSQQNQRCLKPIIPKQLGNLI